MQLGPKFLTASRATHAQGGGRVHFQTPDRDLFVTIKAIAIPTLFHTAQRLFDTNQILCALTFLRLRHSLPLHRIDTGYPPHRLLVEGHRRARFRAAVTIGAEFGFQRFKHRFEAAYIQFCHSKFSFRILRKALIAIGRA